jgi:hypothetical protein
MSSGTIQGWNNSGMLAPIGVGGTNLGGKGIGLGKLRDGRWEQQLGAWSRLAGCELPKWEHARTCEYVPAMRSS